MTIVLVFCLGMAVGYAIRAGLVDDHTTTIEERSSLESIVAPPRAGGIVRPPATPAQRRIHGRTFYKTDDGEWEVEE